MEVMGGIYPEGPNHGLRGYHKTGYSVEEPDLIKSVPCQMRRVTMFVTKGVDKRVDHNGFLYGSGSSYPTQKLKLKCSFERSKLHQQQLQAEHDIASYKAKKKKEKRRLAQQKIKDREMLQQYHPWGKPGAGAPMQTNSGTALAQRHNFGNEDTLVDSTKGSSSKSYFPFGRPGGGAPCQSESGSLITTVTVDPETRFQKQIRKEVEISLRYKKDRSEEPSSNKHSSNLAPVTSEVVRKHNRRLHYTEQLNAQRAEARQRKLTEQAALKERPPSYSPWSSDSLVRDASGKIIPRRAALTPTGPVQTGEREGLLGQLYRMKVRGGSRRGMRQAGARGGPGETVMAASGYNPWGKPGGGAPLLTTAVYGNFEKKNEDLSDEEPRNRGGSGVVSWMRRGNVGKSPHLRDNFTLNYLPDTKSIKEAHEYCSELVQQAATKNQQELADKEQSRKDEKEHVDTINKLWPISNHQLKVNTRKDSYSNTLQQMIQDQREEKRLEKSKELEREHKHVKAFDGLWGRPGGGAPRHTKSGTLDTSPHNYSTLMTTSTNTDQHQFRRA